jgi:cell division septum initiation protein DivIVA
LEKTGVIDAITRALVALYEAQERPQNAIDFVKEYLGAPVGVDVEELKATIQAQKEEIEQLKRQIAEKSSAS